MLRSLPISDTSILWGARVRSSADKLPAVLTLREKEAAYLIACGLSNRQIASELFLYERAHCREPRLKDPAQAEARLPDESISTPLEITLSISGTSGVQQACDQAPFVPVRSPGGGYPQGDVRKHEPCFPDHRAGEHEGQSAAFGHARH